MEDPHKKTVYFIRHGQSIDNAAPVFQSLDSPLSEAGRAQAQKVGSRFTEVQFDALISSPILRAKETAKYISKQTNKEIVYSDLFVERVKPDEINGKAWTDSTASKVWREWERSLYTPNLRVSNGENYDDTVIRVDKALTYLEERSESKLVVVTHGYFLRAIIARVLAGSNLSGPIMKQVQQVSLISNTGITVLIYSNAFEENFMWRLQTYNDSAHLNA